MPCRERTLSYCTAPSRPLLVFLLPKVLEVRHGAVLGLAELLPALKGCSGTELTEARVRAVAEVVPNIEKNRLYRGKVRAAAPLCRLCGRLETKTPTWSCQLHSQRDKNGILACLPQCSPLPRLPRHWHLPVNCCRAGRS